MRLELQYGQQILIQSDNKYCTGDPFSRYSTNTSFFFHSLPMQHFNYLLTYDSYVPLYNRFHRGEWITRVSGGEGALDTSSEDSLSLLKVSFI